MTDIYSPDYQYIPMTITRYIRKGSRWVVVSVEDETISRNQVRLVLADDGLPFEKSHRRGKADRYGHSNPYDWFSSIDPDGMRKTKWLVHFNDADRIFLKLVRDQHN